MMSLVVVLKVTLVFALGSAALLGLRSASSSVRHFMSGAALAASVLVLFVGNLSFGIESPVFHFAVNASQTLNDSHGRSIDVLKALWITGALIVVLRFLAGIAWLAWQTHRASEPLPNLTPMRVRLAHVSTPLVWGWLRPTMLMPYSSAKWTQAERDLAIAHELAHVRRYDAWWSLLPLAACSLYWFHPLVWWLKARMREQQEMACDEHVLQSGAQPAEYAGLLVETARHMNSPALFGCAMVQDAKHVRARVERILSFSNTLSGASGRIAAAAACLLLIAGALFPARAETVYRIGGDVSAPKIVSKVGPGYTKKAKQDKVQGTVLLDLIVGADGAARKIQVIRSLDSGLDKQAIKAVSHWRFEPAKKAGKPVAVQAHVEVNFRLL